MMPMRKLFLPVVLLAAAMFAYAPIIIADAPYESTMLLIQKIMYFHVPAWFAMFTGVFIAGAGGIWYLWKRDPRGDRVAVAAAEITVMFGAMGLVTGPLWAKKAWGVAWQWDAKLIMAAMLELIFIAYLLLRKYGGPGSEKLAATVALFGMANVPFVYYAVNIWRTIHPANTVVPTLPAGMRGAFWFCVVSFLLLFSLMLALRVRLERLRADLDELYLADEA
jgi:heme exporter protein C